MSLRNATKEEQMYHDSQRTAIGIERWIRYSAPWSELGDGNTLEIFHDPVANMYRVEMELDAECVYLIALISELNFADRWCSFVTSSHRKMDTTYLLQNMLVFRLVFSPICKFILGLIIINVYQSYYTYASMFCIKCEDRHESIDETLWSSYLAFNTFSVQIEKDIVTAKTCCSFEIKILNVFYFIPLAVLRIACREMFACFVKQWTRAAQQLSTRQLEMFAVRKKIDADAAYYSVVTQRLNRS